MAAPVGILPRSVKSVQNAFMFRARICLLVPALLACVQSTHSPRPRTTPAPPAFQRPTLGAQELESVTSGPKRPGPVLARLQVSAPLRSPFVIHGTIPVPHDYLGPEGHGLILMGPGASHSAARAQIEIVSRAPGGAADVIEVSALVSLAPDTRPGAPVTFDVLHATGADGTRLQSPSVPVQVSSLLEDPASGPFLLRTHDVFGNLYTVDLRTAGTQPGTGSTRTLAAGIAKRVRRRHATLVPTDERVPDSALPHLMGVHAYTTEWAGDERISLDLRIHNGAVAGARPPSATETPPGFVYWDALELVLPRAWVAATLFDDPALGQPREESLGGVPVTVLPLVARQKDGALHMMPPQAQFHRRLVLSPRATPADGSANPALVGLAFCTPGQGLWSWFNPDTAHYFPQRGMLCTWERYRRGSEQANTALRAALTSELDVLKAALAGGRPSGNAFVGSSMGWAHPWGAPAPGVTGGGGIVFVDGQRTAACASQAGVQRLMLEHRMNASRQAEAAWNAQGDPVGFHAWLDDSGSIPFDFRTNGRMVPDAFKWPARHGPASSDQVATVFERGLRPPYDLGTPQLADGAPPSDRAALLSWLPHDGQHMVRYTKNTKALVWLAADALAEDDLLLSAELFRLMFHEAPHREEAWSRGVTLRQFERHASEHPRQGAWIGRDQAWGIDAMCAAYSVSDPEWRARNFVWFPRVASFLLKAAMPSGVVQRSSLDKILGHDRYDAAQTYESLFLLHAMRCLNESVLRGRADDLCQSLQALVLRTLDFLYAEPIFAQVHAPRPPHQLRVGPRAKFAVALRDGYATAPFSDAATWGAGYLPDDGFDDGVEITYSPALLGYAYLLTRQAPPTGLANLYLTRMLPSGASDGWGALVESLFNNAARASNDNSGNWASLMGQLQSLGL
ncbi:MAG: hypothetical protein ACI8QZ_002193 [Chlamydiales bacterium]|jgi:hypothetical protein